MLKNNDPKVKNRFKSIAYDFIFIKAVFGFLIIVPNFVLIEPLFAKQNIKINRTIQNTVTEKEFMSIEEMHQLMNEISEARIELLIYVDGKTDQEQLDKVNSAANYVDVSIKRLNIKNKQLQITDLVQVWGDFKKTRESEIIPLVQSHKLKKANDLVHGIQMDRLKKIYDLIRSIQRPLPREIK